MYVWTAWSLQVLNLNQYFEIKEKKLKMENNNEWSAGNWSVW